MADDGVRHELLGPDEQRFFRRVERIFYADETRELAKKLAALPEHTAMVRLQLAVSAAQVPPGWTGGPR